MATKCPKCDFENPDTVKFCGECGTQLGQDIPEVTKTIETPVQELTRGTVFAGRYEIIEQLGIGGMGAVYRVEDTKAKEEIALKLIKPEIATDKKTIDRFSNELTTARKIRHKNICGMYDLGEDKGSYYITMEYVPGEDLKSLIRRVRIDTGTAIKIAKQVCEGLEEAHRLGVVHRDLKPSNIMIDKDGNARIMDFGIARSIEAKGITDRGVMIGTPEYLSPEQAETKEVDHRSDIYSLGVILYEMVTGQRPFEGETALSVARKHADEIPREPKEINPQIPDDLNFVIMKCLEKDKEKRYQSVNEMRSELENIERGIPTTDREISRRKPLPSKEITVTFALKKLLVPALLFIAVVIIGLVIWQLLPEKEGVPSEPSKPSVAVLPFEDLSAEKNQEYLCYGIVDSVISALSNIKDLRVPARGSPSLYKKGEKDYKEIGVLLNVKYVLDGTLQKSGDRLRITPRLINVADESILWSEKYDKEMQDIFSIQDDITQAIVNKLKLNLLAEDKVYKRGTESVEAYNQYLLGQFHLARRTPRDDKKAYDYFNRAIELDPNYALAFVGLADTYLLFEFLPSQVRSSKAEEAIAKALEIDENLAEAHNSLAWMKFVYYWDWKGAEREFKRAIELNPNYATAHQWYAEYLSNMGRLDEARQEIEKAHELSPLSLIINATDGVIDFYGRHYDKAILQYKKTIALDPNFPRVYFYLYKAYMYKGLYKESLEALEEWRRIGKYGKEFFKGGRMILNAHMGRKKEAIQYYEQIKSNLKDYDKAKFHFRLGDVDQGFVYLQTACEARDTSMRFIKVEPVFDNIRNDPKYKEILKKMNLE